MYDALLDYDKRVENMLVLIMTLYFVTLLQTVCLATDDSVTCWCLCRWCSDQVTSFL